MTAGPQPAGATSVGATSAGPTSTGFASTGQASAGPASAESILASWTTQQLVAFLGTVAACRDELTAVQTAAEAVALATDAEIGAVVVGGRVISCIGFGQSPVPAQALVEACTSPGATLEIPGVGTAEVISAALGRIADGYLLSARVGDPFGAGERGMVNAMANVLGLTLDVVSALDAERGARESSERTTEQVTELLTKVREQRQLTLNRFSRIQRAIASRSRLEDVLDAITTTACELVECDVAVLHVVAEDQNGAQELVSTVGRVAAGGPAGGQTIDGQTSAVPTIGARAEQAGHPLLDNDFAARPEADAFGEPRVRSAVAVPVRQGPRTVGHLMLGSRTPGHTFGALEESLATTLAEHAGLAVQDAKTVGELHEALDDAMHRASHDGLTGLANRAAFMAELEQLLADRSAQEHPDSPDAGLTAWVLYIDLDHFKTVNDTLGHPAGDQLLMVTASRLRHGVREGDLVARLGGDEFAVLLRSATDLAQARESAERLHQSICRPARLIDQQLDPSASIGVAPALAGDTPTTLVSRADSALYQAKRLGRGQVAISPAE